MEKVDHLRRHQRIWVTPDQIKRAITELSHVPRRLHDEQAMDDPREDMRTSLRMILACAQVLRKEILSLSPEDQQALLEQIIYAVGRQAVFLEELNL